MSSSPSHHHGFPTVIPWGDHGVMIVSRNNASAFKSVGHKRQQIIVRSIDIPPRGLQEQLPVGGNLLMLIRWNTRQKKISLRHLGNTSTVEH